MLIFKKISSRAMFVVFTTLCLLSLFVQAEATPLQINLKKNWQVISSASLSRGNDAAITKADYDISQWYKATIPSTVLNVLVENKVYQNILDGLGLQSVSAEQFAVPWWYRTSFTIKKLPINAQLHLQGLNYRADVWLNGQQIADKEKIYGVFLRHQLDITKFLQHGENILALKVYPPLEDDLRIGFTDWNPNPPDKSMGVIRDVQIFLNNGLEIKDPFVEVKLNSPKNNKAKLTVQLTIVNHQAKDAFVNLQLHAPELFTFEKQLKLPANALKTIKITPKDEPGLLVSNPKLWWPNQMGEPHLYKLNVAVKHNNALADSQSLHFGIRKVESFTRRFSEKGKKTASYFRYFKINGYPVLIRGAAWTDSMLLNDSTRRVKDQLRYAKDMNLNAIRLEGFWGKDETLFSECDRLGLLVMIGWSAQWEWPLRGFRKAERCDNNYGCYTEEKDKELILASFTDRIKLLRNHPSIFTWVFASDLKPKPDLEKKLGNALKKYSPGVPYVISAAEKLSAMNKAPSGIKMRGPYIYVPPVYWYANVKNGGAFGFNSETCPGAEVPPLESLQRLLGNSKYYWPNNNPVWVYHEGGHPLFQALKRYNSLMAVRYGVAGSLDDYAFKAQLMNYESVRPMFEAFSAYKNGNPYLINVPATGVFHWMLNAAWPKFFWQLYDYYLVPGSAYFAAKEANKPLHVIYDYAKQSVYLNNNTLRSAQNLVVSAQTWDANSKKIAEKNWQVEIDALHSKKLGLLNIIKKIETPVYFVELVLQDAAGRQLDRNVYWLAKKGDKMGVDTDISQSADYTSLQNLPKSKLIVNYTLQEQAQEIKISVSLENPTQHISFFNRLNIKTSSGNIVSPIYWSDNFITLFPKQSLSISGSFRKSCLHGFAPIFKIDGLNSTVEYHLKSRI